MCALASSTIGFAIVLAYTLVAHAQDGNLVMRPGAWEYVVHKTARMPDIAVKRDLGTQKTTYCMSKEALATPPLSDDAIRQRGGKCTSPAVKYDGGIEHWSMSCAMPDGKRVAFTADMQRSSEHLRSRLVITTFEANAQTELVMAGTATFRGDCTADMVRYPGRR